MVKNRNNPDKRKFRIFAFIARLGIICAIIFLAYLFIIGYIWKALRFSEYFTVKDVAARNSGSIDLSYLKGRGIFGVDLRKESSYLLKSFPEYADVRMAKVLPGRIFADFIKRTPLALVKLYRPFAVDRSGAVFFLEPQNDGVALPVITGLETKLFAPRQGKKYNIRELSLALSAIELVKKNRTLEGCSIKRIDASSAANLSFFMEDWQANLLEVKLGADNIGHKVMMLAGLLSAARKDIGSIKYIDLRFKEPVIKFNDVKIK